ncbi:MAG: hypothetical protein WBG30_08730 [Psychrilyobacter sp.]|uniref:hypothetical protein n=1 Tax=Psychrilyobacter sp. TaxID=2586924 RepID=UPI003C78C3BD
MQLQEFINKAREKREKRIKVAQIEIKDIGLVEFQRPVEKDFVAYMNKINGSSRTIIEHLGKNEEGEDLKREIQEPEDMGMILKASTEFVYKTCSFFRAKELRDEVTDGNYFSIPSLFLETTEIMDLASKIMDKFEIQEEKAKDEEDLKN